MKITDDVRNKPEISIIVPVYNSGFYIQECIESLCKQTFSNIEIILVEDGSTDVNCTPKSGQLKVEQTRF